MSSDPSPEENSAKSAESKKLDQVGSVNLAPEQILRTINPADIPRAWKNVGIVFSREEIVAFQKFLSTQFLSYEDEHLVTAVNKIMKCPTE